METQHIALSCDDLFIAILTNDSENLADNQTVELDLKYAEELQLQEAIMSSLQVTDNPWEISREIGESSKQGSKKAGESSQSLCEICAEKKDSDEMFPLENCSHNFCTECTSKHISITINKMKISEKPLVVTCPGIDCTSILEITNSEKILPGDVVSMWDDALCESLILPEHRFYCPFKNCSGMLVNDDDDDDKVGGGIREAECPYCWRLFCAKCRVPWHSGVNCEEFLRMRENERSEREDLKLHDLAKENKWQRCPNCKFFVEKTQGCLHITCRCGYNFCYACGKAWTPTHGGCQ